MGSSSSIWSFRLSLRPVSKVLNNGWEGVSIFIYNAMQHVRTNKELSIFYLAKKLDNMDFFGLMVIHGQTWQVVRDIVTIFKHEREVSTGVSSSNVAWSNILKRFLYHKSADNATQNQSWFCCSFADRRIKWNKISLYISTAWVYR